MTLSIITIKMQYKDTQLYRKIYNSQHNILLNVVYADCRNEALHNVIMKNVIFLSVVAPLTVESSTIFVLQTNSSVF